MLRQAGEGTACTATSTAAFYARREFPLFTGTPRPYRKDNKQAASCLISVSAGSRMRAIDH
jgi:hypothetical protein